MGKEKFSTREKRWACAFLRGLISSFLSLNPAAEGRLFKKFDVYVYGLLLCFNSSDHGPFAQ